MTNDPSKTITSTSTVPAPDALDTPQPDMVKTVGGTTFEIYFHFSQTSKETFADKVLRLINCDNETSKNN